MYESQALEDIRQQPAGNWKGKTVKRKKRLEIFIRDILSSHAFNR
jgi:hypothetical protein